MNKEEKIKVLKEMLVDLAHFYGQDTILTNYIINNRDTGRGNEDFLSEQKERNTKLFFRTIKNLETFFIKELEEKIK